MGLVPRISMGAHNMTKIGKILYVHASQRTKKITPGRWFYDTGQCVQCGEAGKTKDGRWTVSLQLLPGKELPKNALIFDSEEEMKQYVSEYFEVPVVKVTVREFLALVDLS
jgi:hypothetical protein